MTEAEENITVTKLTVSPNQCELTQAMTFYVEFSLKRAVPNHAWHIVYEADYTNKRHVLELFKSAPGSTLSPGPNSFTQTVGTVDTSKVKEKYLLQVGMMRLILMSGEEVVATMNMVTQVSKDSKSGALIRNVISPVE